MSGIHTIEKRVNPPTGLDRVMGELKEALDEHDRLTQPPSWGPALIQRRHKQGEAEFPMAAVGKGSPKAKCGTRSLPHTHCFDDPRIQETDIRNGMPEEQGDD